MKKRLFATLLALVMALGLTAAAWADDPVTGVEYVDENGTVQTLTDIYTEINESSKPTEWSTGWYVVNGNVEIGRVKIPNGMNVGLILCDGAELTITAYYGGGVVNMGLYIDGGSLTIYGQTGQTGKLSAKFFGGEGYGIYNKGTLAINGGTVVAKGDIGIERSAPKLPASYKWRTSEGGSFTTNTCTVSYPHSEAYGYVEIAVPGDETVAYHNFDELVNEVPATCTATGTKGYQDCSACGKRFDADGKEITDLTIPAGHKLTHVPAKEATRQEAGNIEYWQCSGCKQCFADEAMEKTIDQADTVIAKLPPKKNPSTPATPEPETVGSPKTTDPGVLLTAALSVVSLLGMGYIGKKR